MRTTIFKKPRYHWLKNFFSSLLFLSGTSWLTSGLEVEWEFQERVFLDGGKELINILASKENLTRTSHISLPGQLPGFLRAVPVLIRPLLKAAFTCGCLGPGAELKILHRSYVCTWGEARRGGSGEQWRLECSCSRLCQGSSVPDSPSL